MRVSWGHTDAWALVDALQKFVASSEEAERSHLQQLDELHQVIQSEASDAQDRLEAALAAQEAALTAQFHDFVCCQDEAHNARLKAVQRQLQQANCEVLYLRQLLQGVPADSHPSHRATPDASRHQHGTHTSKVEQQLHTPEKAGSLSPDTPSPAATRTSPGTQLACYRAKYIRYKESYALACKQQCPHRGPCQQCRELLLPQVAPAAAAAAPAEHLQSELQPEVLRALQATPPSSHPSTPSKLLAPHDAPTAAAGIGATHAWQQQQQGKQQRYSQLQQQPGMTRQHGQPLHMMQGRHAWQQQPGQQGQGQRDEEGLHIGEPGCAYPPSDSWSHAGPQEHGADLHAVCMVPESLAPWAPDQADAYAYLHRPECRQAGGSQKGKQQRGHSPAIPPHPTQQTSKAVGAVAAVGRGKLGHARPPLPLPSLPASPHPTHDIHNHPLRSSTWRSTGHGSLSAAAGTHPAASIEQALMAAAGLDSQADALELPPAMPPRPSPMCLTKQVAPLPARQAQARLPTGFAPRPSPVADGSFSGRRAPASTDCIDLRTPDSPPRPQPQLHSPAAEPPAQPDLAKPPLQCYSRPGGAAESHAPAGSGDAEQQQDELAGPIPSSPAHHTQDGGESSEEADLTQPSPCATARLAAAERKAQAGRQMPPQAASLKQAQLQPQAAPSGLLGMSQQRDSVQGGGEGVGCSPSAAVRKPALSSARSLSLAMHAAAASSVGGGEEELPRKRVCHGPGQDMTHSHMLATEAVAGDASRTGNAASKSLVRHRDEGAGQGEPGEGPQFPRQGWGQQQQRDQQQQQQQQMAQVQGHQGVRGTTDGAAASSWDAQPWRRGRQQQTGHAQDAFNVWPLNPQQQQGQQQQGQQQQGQEQQGQQGQQGRQGRQGQQQALRAQGQGRQQKGSEQEAAGADAWLAPPAPSHRGAPHASNPAAQLQPAGSGGSRAAALQPSLPSAASEGQRGLPGAAEPGSSKAAGAVAEAGAQGFKYTEVVRGKDARAALTGFACRDCDAFFDAMASWGVAAGGDNNLVLRCGHKAPAAPLAATKQGKANAASKGAATEGLGVKEEEGGPQGARQAAVQAMSRHRARYLPPSSTPPGFWNLGFPDSP